MKSDKVTTFLLAVIATCLCLSVLRPGLLPDANAAVPVPTCFRHLSLTGGDTGFWLFNHETGEIYVCDSPREGAPVLYVGRLEAPGKPLVR